MMDHAASNFDVDLEDGEISNSSEEVYIPLTRPCKDPESCSPLANTYQMQAALTQVQDEEDDDDSQADSLSDESSDAGCLNKLTKDNSKTKNLKKKRVRRTVMVRQTIDPDALEKRARFKKYNIWAESLQEEALAENMRGCDVTRNYSSDRNVENYDYTLRYRLNGGNSLKRRLSNNSTDDYSDSSELLPACKRGRISSCDGESSQRPSVKSRLGHRPIKRRNRRASSASGSENSNEPRHLLDLQERSETQPLELARELANKLFEQNEDLLVRIVEVLGTEIPAELYKETQRIEADGGMMIKNNKRRRTPGGVFLFLLKHHNSLTEEQQKAIFKEKKPNSENLKEVRHLLDLNDTTGRDALDVAKEIAKKLNEESDEKIVKIVEILGTELPLEIFNETQRIEAEGGMLIKSKTRRRTAGGVFYYLIKHHNGLTVEQFKAIFKDNHAPAVSRERKVEQLKKQLSEQEKEMPALSTRKDHYMGTDLSTEQQAGNLSNPPPSPVSGIDIQDQEVVPICHSPNSNMPSTSAALRQHNINKVDSNAYYDDFLDIDGDMDYLHEF